MPRINLTLTLPPLDRGSRIGIWNNQIQDLLEEGAIHPSQSANLRGLAQQKWSKDDFNGHQIKKAVKTARVLAEKKGKTLGEKEIETMLKMTREFKGRAAQLKKDRNTETGDQKSEEDLDGFEQVEKP